MWHWIWRLSPDVHIHVGDKAADEGRKDETFSTASPNLQSLLQQNKQTFPAAQGHSDDGRDDEHLLHSVTRVRVVVETEASFLLLQPYADYSLRDLLSYSPALMDACHSRPLFVLYQVLQAMRLTHARALPLGRLSLDTVLLDPDLWVSVLCPQKHALTSLASALAASSSSDSSPEERKRSSTTSETRGRSEQEAGAGETASLLRHHHQSDSSVAQTAADSQSASFLPHSQEPGSQPPASPTHAPRQQPSGYTDEDERQYLEGCRFLEQRGYVSLARSGVAELVEAWVERRLSNFQYLLVLNHLAGRRLNDPNNHPVLPWVMDFSHPHDG